MASICPHNNEKFDAQTAQQIKEKWEELYQYFNQKFGKVEFLFENQTLSIYTLQVTYSLILFFYILFKTQWMLAINETTFYSVIFQSSFKISKNAPLPGLNAGICNGNIY